MRSSPLLFSLAAKSLLNRRLTAGLTVLSVAVSVALLIGVDRVRTEARTSFTNTISGADLIVGARSGPLNLLLYSVFRIGDATNNIGWESYQEIRARPEVAWTIPISLGDSHRGFRVMGTDDGYFEHYRFARGRTLDFADGGRFVNVNDAVLGADVAKSLDYAVGDRIIVSHGIGDVSFEDHDEIALRGNRHPRQDRHTGGPDGSCHVGGHRSHSLAMGHDAAGPGNGGRRRRLGGGTQTRCDNGVHRGPRVEVDAVRSAAIHQRIRGRAADGHRPGGLRFSSSGNSWAPRRPRCWWSAS